MQKLERGGRLAQRGLLLLLELVLVLVLVLLVEGVLLGGVKVQLHRP